MLAPYFTNLQTWKPGLDHVGDVNVWNTKYLQNVTGICKNALSVNYILLECPITTQVIEEKWV